jgi:hypothetical protein
VAATTRELPINVGEVKEIEGTDLKVRMIRFLPDATDPESTSLTNPAAEIEVSGGELKEPVVIVLTASAEMTRSEPIMELVRKTKMLFRFAMLPQTELLLVGGEGDLHIYQDGQLKEQVNIAEAEYTPMFSNITLKLDKYFESGVEERIHSDDNPNSQVAVEFEIENNGQKSSHILQLLDNNVTREMTAADPERYFYTLDGKNFLSLYIRGDYIKDWRSHASMLEPNGNSIEHVIRVNEPLVYNGFYYYQTDWRPKVPYGETPEKWYSILRVTKDPGLLLVYLGIAMMTFGMIWAFYIGPRFKKKENS